MTWKRGFKEKKHAVTLLHLLCIRATFVIFLTNNTFLRSYFHTNSLGKENGPPSAHKICKITN